MIEIGHIFDAAPCEPHSAFDMFGVYVIDFENVTLSDTCTDVVDMIDTDLILDVAPLGPRSIFICLGFQC